MPIRLPVFFVFLFGLATAAPVSAQPQPECVTVAGQTTCGYGCKTASGQTACAQHPGGACTAAYGKLACGFSCVAAFGELRCAQNPGGVCQANAGKITCFDPQSASVPPGTSVPQASCVVAGGTMACGYHCTTAAGSVQCAQTPAGACGVVGTTLTCNDPPAHLAFLPQTPRMQCERGAGRIACGYGCKSGGGDVRCAQTPGGVCQQNAGTITCFDPPAP